MLPVNQLVMDGGVFFLMDLSPHCPFSLETCYVSRQSAGNCVASHSLMNVSRPEVGPNTLLSFRPKREVEYKTQVAPHVQRMQSLYDVWSVVGGVVVSALASYAGGRGFDSRIRQP